MIETTDRGQRVLQRIEAGLRKHGVSGFVLQDILANGVEQPRYTTHGPLFAAKWEAEADSSVKACPAAYVMLMETFGRPGMTAHHAARIKAAVDAGGDEEEAVLLCISHAVVTSIAGAQGRFSVIGCTTHFDEQHEGANLARIAQRTPNLVVRVTVCDGQPSHLFEGVRTKIAIPVPCAPSEAANLRRDLVANPLLHLIMPRTLDGLQSLVMASVLVAAGAARLGNVRMQALRLAQSEHPNPEDVSVWCEAYDRLVALRTELGV